MSQILFSLSTWLHAVATVIFIGHYLLLALIYLPVLAKEQAGGMILSAISKRSRSWIYTSLVIFMVTGSYLTIVDRNYLGIGNFGNPWGVFMLIKHILIVGMIVMGFWFNAILRVGPLMSSNTGAEQAILRFGLYSRWMAVCGVLVLLLTALAQVE
ncbi:MAG TPA: hypothetical protein VFI68_01880 [Anaerolineales bacterium]|nr:hypothetical protein [Anaerolineales bacterium]